MVTSLSPQERESQAAHIRDDRRGELVGVYVTLLVLASLSVIVRFWGRRLQGAQWRADDYTMMLAVVCAFNPLYAPKQQADLHPSDFLILSVCAGLCR